MNKSILILSIFIISFFSLNAQIDTIIIVNSVQKITQIDNKNDCVLRTHMIQFKPFSRDLDTINCETHCFLDSLVSIIKKDTLIKQIQIGIHLSMKEWSDEYSYNLDKMWEQIIAYMNSKDINNNLFVGKSYYDTLPVKNKPSKYESQKVFWDTEYKYNRRVEFLFNYNK